MEQQPNQDIPEHFLGIPGSDHWRHVKIICKGESQDRKLAVTDAGGHKYLVRLFHSHQYGQVSSLVRLLRLLRDCSMPVPDPADYGFCAQKQSIYLMTRWIEGESLPLCLPEQSAVDQYMLGHQAAVTLYALHGCQAPHTGKNWWHQLKQDTDDLLLQIGSEKNAAAPIHQLTGFVDKNREFAMHQPSVLLHGDLQPDNMLLSNDQTVSFIDFTQWHFGDPLSDVATAIAGISQISPHFATGLLDAYFNYHVTTKTFRLLALYGAINCLQHYCQACRCGDGEQERALLEINHFMKTCNSLQSVVPEWYEPMPQIRVHSD